MSGWYRILNEIGGRGSMMIGLMANMHLPVKNVIPGISTGSRQTKCTRRMSKKAFTELKLNGFFLKFRSTLSCIRAKKIIKAKRTKDYITKLF